LAKVECKTINVLDINSHCNNSGSPRKWRLLKLRTYFFVLLNTCRISSKTRWWNLSGFDIIKIVNGGANKLIIFGFVLIAIVVGIIFVAKAGNQPGNLDGFAGCLKEKGAIFYGAFWCSHCQNQKKMFGKSVKYLPYVECSTSDGKKQLPACQEKNIDGYPTWVFADETREVGEVPLEKLSEKTGCLLPQ